MSDRMTSIRLPGMSGGAGLADWGKKTPAEMIASIRSYAKMKRDEASEILSAKDEDFRVETYVGVHVQKNREVLQEGRSK